MFVLDPLAPEKTSFCPKGRDGCGLPPWFTQQDAGPVDDTSGFLLSYGRYVAWLAVIASRLPPFDPE